MENAFNDDTLLARWLANELTPEELASFQEREEFAELQAIVREMEGLDMPPFSEKDSWEKLRAKIKAQPVNSTEKTPADPVQTIEDQKVKPLKIESVRAGKPLFRRIAVVRILTAAAAVAIILLGYWWLTGDDFHFDTTVNTSVAEQKEITLPDGSSVLLNAQSEIGFSAEDWPEKRVAGLEGEAYFRAKKGKKFTVLTKQGTIEVVGTAFNVYARDQELEVKCTEGKVQVINPEATERVLLKAGEQVGVLNGRMQQRQGIYFSPRWFKGESAFRSAPLDKVFNELERQYNVIVIRENSVGRSYTGKFEHSDLEKALKIICDPMQLKYEVSGDTVRVF